MTFQSIFAVITGFVAIAVVVMVGSAAAALALQRPANPDDPARAPPGYLAYDFALGQLAAVVGGLVVARLAPQSPLEHAMALSGLMLAMSVFCLVAYGDKGPPRWYQAALSSTSAVVVIVTAWIVTSQA